MKTALEIQNLKCGGCAHTITTRLAELDNIDKVAVDNENNTVSFSYQTELHLKQAIELLSKLGYPVDGEANPISKKAKSFVSCAVGRMNS